MRQKSVTVKQIKRLDEIAVGTYGVPSLALMENAGRSVAAEILRIIKRIKRPTVAIVCGLGNNAGDGFVAARHLMNAGVRTKVYLIGRGSRLKHDAAVNYKILKKIKYPITEVRNAHVRSVQDIKNADIIVDAIFGVGLNRTVAEPFAGIIEAINRSGRKIVAVDIPSGLDGTSGKIHGSCVKADVTVTFSFVKKGFLKGQGPKHVGKVVVADIGIPKKLLKK